MVVLAERCGSGRWLRATALLRAVEPKLMVMAELDSEVAALAHTPFLAAASARLRSEATVEAAVLRID